jgi:hypothetical protein
MKPHPGTYEYELQRLLLRLENLEPGSDEYKAVLNAIDILAKSNDKKKISPDTLVMGAIQILGILLVLNYEQAHVVTSKAFGMIRGRL